MKTIFHSRFVHLCFSQILCWAVWMVRSRLPRDINLKSNNKLHLISATCDVPMETQREKSKVDFGYRM